MPCAASPAPGSEFTDADRERVAEVVRRLLDEMADSHSTAGMFGPHAEIIDLILADQRITGALTDNGLRC